MFASSDNIIVEHPDSDNKCECGHTCFWHANEAGTGRCVRCSCPEFRLDLDSKAA